MKVVKGASELSTATTAVSTPTLDALARYRVTVLTRANQLIGERAPAPLPDSGEALPAMTGLLMTSLEELKVAEEELREQNARLLERHAEEEQRLFHYRQLFLHTPMPALITDLYATIIEANAAATELFRREAKHLDGKPLSVLVDRAEREEFRRQLSRISSETALTDWRLLMQRTGNLPIEVHATVKVVPTLGETGSGVLYWLLRVRSPSN